MFLNPNLEEFSIKPVFKLEMKNLVLFYKNISVLMGKIKCREGKKHILRKLNGFTSKKEK